MKNLKSQHLLSLTPYLILLTFLSVLALIKCNIIIFDILVVEITFVNFDIHHAFN